MCLAGAVSRAYKRQASTHFGNALVPFIDKLLASDPSAPFEEQCLRFHETRRAVKTASSEQVRQPIYTGGMGTWRRYEKHLDDWKETLGPIIDDLPEVVKNAGL